jgi:glucose-6-phosphate 1-dehydrogenase
MKTFQDRVALVTGGTSGIGKAAVVVTLKRPPLLHLSADARNTLRFRLSAEVSITLGTRVKQAGEQMLSEGAELKFVRRPTADHLDAYERLLVDAMAGDATLFAREDGVEAAWSLVQPILDDPTPVPEYAAGTWGPEEAEALTADVGGWHTPLAQSGLP